MKTFMDFLFPEGYGKQKFVEPVFAVAQRPKMSNFRRKGRAHRADNNNNYPSRKRKPENDNNNKPKTDENVKEKYSEYEANAFSRLFERPRPNEERDSRLFNAHDYTHGDAIKFAEKSREWAEIFEERKILEPAPDDESIPGISEFDSERCIGAYYRLISQQDDKYILMAKHTNMHGFHRGDLRFVEVNARTVTKGFERFSVIGKLYLGDDIVVTKLAKIANKPLNPPSAITVTHDSSMFWEVAEMRVWERNIQHNIVFAFMKNGSAIVKGHLEAAAVQVNKNEPIDSESLYTGALFTAGKSSSKYTQDYKRKTWKKLISYVDCFTAYPNPLATIYEYKMCPTRTERFKIGYDALKTDETDEAMQIIELCTEMGQSAVKALSDGRVDSRMFPMRNPVKEENGVRFSIPNPLEYPTEGLWNLKNRIRFEGNGEKIDATIETVLVDQTNRVLQIFAEVSRESLCRISFRKGTFFVYQREAKKSINSKRLHALEPYSNGKRIIDTLYGGPSLKDDALIEDTAPKCIFPSDPPVELNEFQNRYVQMITSGDHPLVLGSSPFGCGKSMTIMMAAIEKCKNHEDSQQLLITQSNYASVNLIDIARKVKDSQLTVMRYVAGANWKELPENCRTEYDFPVLLLSVFNKVVTGELKCETREWHSVLAYLVEEKIVKMKSLNYSFRRYYEKNKKDRRQYPIDRGMRAIIRIFLGLYKPNVIVTTADTLNAMMIRLNPFDNVVCVQIDEAGQLPECALISLLRYFPDANYGLIGDIKQLPPYCEDELKGKLKEYGIGNTMERAIEAKMFPEAILRYVYRCHPKTTDLLSELFYDGKLISGVKEDQRNEFMRKRPDFWPNHHYPIIVVHNRDKAFKIGTSWGNRAEKILAKQIVDSLLEEKDGYQLKPSDIGVISFYAGQTAILSDSFRDTGVKCGTVDAFQGSEKEVIILCCTNERISEFMQLSNRLNVAMSRARQATIIIGNLNGLSEAKYWKDIVKKVEENGGVADTRKYPFHVNLEKLPDAQSTGRTVNYDEGEEISEAMEKLKIDRGQNHSNREKNFLENRLKRPNRVQNRCRNIPNLKEIDEEVEKTQNAPRAHNRGRRGPQGKSSEGYKKKKTLSEELRPDDVSSYPVKNVGNRRRGARRRVGADRWNRVERFEKTTPTASTPNANIEPTN
ncbi:hypothetical protein B9Z55_012892 [Caenorhabditis nigoni]|uniref:Uncharacterized protein n=1 Tax=Caenorhabditis nigoni TaxID=1611254 RepID=A0A2G5TZF4_9PELO|nr:hypothetical protein B9Z55_012892 [Caenorhabditis nigoni]